MKVLEKTELIKLLIDWGVHESRGRAQGKLTGEQRAFLNGEHKDFYALQFILNYRAPLIAPLLQATPIDCWQVEISPDDIPLLRVLGQPSSSLIDSTREHPNQDSNWIQSLAGSKNEISGPLLAIGREATGQLTFFDGSHRVIAWVKQGHNGLPYPIKVNVITTRLPVAGWE